MPECLKDCLKDMVVGNQTRQKFNHCCQFHCHKYLIFHFSHSFSLHTARVDTPQLWLLILYSFERGSKLEYKYIYFVVLFSSWPIKIDFLHAYNSYLANMIVKNHQRKYVKNKNC